PREAEQICPDLGQNGVQRLFGCERIAAVLENAAGIEDALALGAPETGELGAENRPYLLRHAKQPFAHLGAVAILLVPLLREEAHPEIGEQHADIEGDR